MQMDREWEGAGWIQKNKELTSDQSFKAEHITRPSSNPINWERTDWLLGEKKEN